ncbi:MAG: flagellar basal body rod protein FlgB [Marinovum sp.]|jgi:flagellar basal-body rod protein FlgB|nr:flagellar basal body rod protein FlgB [Marinovum sp.]MDG1425450.1 flagellar basal body rod protein FlgB [Paracoccaceae bacterium]
MQVLKEYLGFSATALNLRERRNNIIGSNIANAATPHYKARDINFEQILKAKEGDGNLVNSSQRHIAFSGAATSDRLQFRQSMNPSVDGNTVELSVEQMEFSENSLRYVSSLNFLNSRITGLLSAIRGE